MRRSCRFLGVAMLSLVASCSFSSPLMAQERARLTKYEPFKLTADLSHLSDKQRQMIVLMIEAAEAMDGCFWVQAYGDRESLLAGISDPALREFAEINYGPWNRLDGNKPFVDGFQS